MLTDVSVQAAVAVQAVHSKNSPQACSRQRVLTKHTRDCYSVHATGSHTSDATSTLLDYWKLRDELYCDGDLVLYGPRVVLSIGFR